MLIVGVIMGVIMGVIVGVIVSMMMAMGVGMVIQVLARHTRPQCCIVVAQIMLTQQILSVVAPVGCPHQRMNVKLGWQFVGQKNS